MWCSPNASPAGSRGRARRQLCWTSGRAFSWPANSRHNKYVTPLVCFHTDFYVRLFVRVRCSDKLATLSALDEALVFTCGSCGSFFINPLGSNKNGLKPAHLTLPATTCVHCASPLAINGPIWARDYCDRTVLQALLAQCEAHRADVV